MGYGKIPRRGCARSMDRVGEDLSKSGGIIVLGSGFEDSL